MEGRRPLLAEVQALVTPTASERPRRTTSGLDGSRVAMVLAVLQQHCGIRLHNHDVFASTVGGARLTEPASDLALAVALASARRSGGPRPTAWSRWARSAWPASCAGSATCPSGSPRPPGSGFRVALVPMEPGERAPGRLHAVNHVAPVPSVDGMRVIGVPDVRSGLRMLKVTREQTERPHSL